jgi:hypothetical protein
LTQGQQVYIFQGRYALRHAKFLGLVPLRTDFCFVQLFNSAGEITKERDIVPIAFMRPVARLAPLP